MPWMAASGHWGAREPEAPGDAPARMIRAAAAAETPGLAREAGADSGKSRIARRTPPPQAAQDAPAQADQKMALPRPRPAIAAREDGESGMPAVRAAKAQPPHGKRAAKALPPIGEAYFASHAPARPPAADPLPPIGQAYFESHSPAASD
jgi:hypothetical protein